MTSRQQCSVEEHDTPCSTSSMMVLLPTIKEEEFHTTPASFQDFRQLTVEKFPNLAFLGPASMAVYWFKMYLKEDWIRCNVAEHDDGMTTQRKRKKTKSKNRRPKKGGNFLHIPKAYTNTNNKVTVQDVLNIGTAGNHYASSYIGLYNMIRKYGTFSRDENGDIHLTGYNCPELQPRQS